MYWISPLVYRQILLAEFDDLASKIDLQHIALTGLYMDQFPQLHRGYHPDLLVTLVEKKVVGSSGEFCGAGGRSLCHDQCGSGQISCSTGEARLEWKM